MSQTTFHIPTFTSPAKSHQIGITEDTNMMKTPPRAMVNSASKGSGVRLGQNGLSAFKSPMPNKSSSGNYTNHNSANNNVITNGIAFQNH